MKKFRLLVLALIALVLLVGCGKENNEDLSPINPDVPGYQLGQNKSEEEIKYDLILDQGEGITWESSREDVIDITGKVTRPSYDLEVTLGVLTENFYKQYKFKVIGYKTELKEQYEFYKNLEVRFETSEYNSYNAYIQSLEELREAIPGKNTYDEAMAILKKVKVSYENIKSIEESTFFKVTIEGEGIEIENATSNNKYPEGHEVIIKTTTTQSGEDVDKIFINGLEIARNNGVFKFVPFKDIEITATYYKALAKGLDDPKAKEYYEGVGIFSTHEKTFHNLRKVFTDYNPTYRESATILQTADWDDSKGGFWAIYDGAILTSRWQWNREHVWPQSRLGLSKDFRASDSNSNRSQITDTHNLRVIVPETNEERSNFYFVDPKEPASSFQVVNSNQYYPGDEHKGDVARIMLYVALRYFGTVTLTRHPSPSNYNKIAQMGNIDVLLKWHQEDPVSDFERKRNDTIFAFNPRANRNPFIDFPELFEPVWNYLIEWDNIRLGIKTKYEQTILEYQDLMTQDLIRKYKYNI